MVLWSAIFSTPVINIISKFIQSELRNYVKCYIQIYMILSYNKCFYQALRPTVKCSVFCELTICFNNFVQPFIHRTNCFIPRLFIKSRVILTFAQNCQEMTYIESNLCNLNSCAERRWKPAKGRT